MANQRDELYPAIPERCELDKVANQENWKAGRDKALAHKPEKSQTDYR